MDALQTPSRLILRSFFMARNDIPNSNLASVTSNDDRETVIIEFLPSKSKACGVLTRNRMRAFPGKQTSVDRPEPYISSRRRCDPSRVFVNRNKMDSVFETTESVDKSPSVEIPAG